MTRTSGTIRFAGQDLTGATPKQIVAAGIIQVPEGRRLFAGMTVTENLLLGAYLPKLRRARAAGLDAAYAMFPVLRERRRQLASTLSGGQQQMVSIARALMGRPRCLMLDEPFLGLSPRLVGEISETIRTIKAQGVTVLFTEQNIQQSLRLSDRGYILESGRLAMAGASRDLLADERLHRIYMGLERTEAVSLTEA